MMISPFLFIVLSILVCSNQVKADVTALFSVNGEQVDVDAADIAKVNIDGLSRIPMTDDLSNNGEKKLSADALPSLLSYDSEDNKMITEGKKQTPKIGELYDIIYAGPDIAKQCNNSTIGGRGEDGEFIQGGRAQSLTCWLWNLNVSIADEHFRKGIFYVSIKDMVCTNFQIGNITSSYNPSSYSPSSHIADQNKKQTSSNENPAISIAISGISATCNGKYKAEFTSGHVTVNVESSPNGPLSLTTTFQSSFLDENKTNGKKIRISTGGNLTSCETNLEVPSENGIIFTGSLSARFIELFAKPIASHVTASLSSEVCPQMKGILDSKLTSSLLRVNKYLEKLIFNDNHGDSRITNYDTKTPRQDGKFANSYFGIKAVDSPLISWDEDMPKLQNMLSKMNNFISSHLDMGVILRILDKIGWLDKHHKKSNSGNETCTDCGIFFRGLNGLTKYMTHGTGLVHIKIPQNISGMPRNFHFEVPAYGILTVTLNYVNITGMDTLTDINVLRPIGDSGTSSSLSSERGFSVVAQLDMNVEPIDGGMIQGKTLQESFLIHTDVSDVHLNADFDFGIIREKFEDIDVGDVLALVHNRGKNGTVACVMPSLLSFALSEITTRMDVNEIKLVPITDGLNFDYSSVIAASIDNDKVNDLERDMDEMLNNLLEMFLNEYNVLVTETLAGFSRGPFKEHLNKYLVDFIKNTTASIDPRDEAKCEESFHPTNVHDFFRFDDSSLVKKMNEWIGADERIESINNFISCVLNFVQDNENDEFGVNPDLLTEFGGFHISLDRFEIENVAKINSLDFMTAEDHFHTSNGVDIGYCGHSNLSDKNKCNDTQVVLSLEVQNADLEFNAFLNLSVSIGNFSSKIGSMIEYDNNIVSHLKIHKIIAQPRCLAAPASDIGLYGSMISIGLMDIGADLSLSLGDIHKNLTYSSEYLGNNASYLLSTITNLIQDVLNSIIQLSLQNPVTGCEQNGTTPSDDESYLDEPFDRILHINIIFVAVAFATSNVLVLFVSYRRSKRAEYSPSYTRMQQSRNLRRKVHCISASEMYSSLMFQKSIPNILRIFVPITIIGTITVFIVSNMSTGASVDLVLSSSDNEAIDLPGIFTFSLGKTVSEMYEAGVYSLMMLVLVFSGIWPYVKLLLMLFSWVTPDTVFSLKKRENLLIWLDALGKFSLVDSFVLVLMLVSFRFHFDVSGVGSIDAFVTPTFGFYTFLFATVMSLIIGHGVTFLHRHSISPNNATLSSGPRESLRCHIYQERFLGGRYLQLSILFQVIWVMLTLLSISLMGIGVTIKSFIFEFKGLAGVALGEKSTASYSLISLGSSIPYSVRDPDDIGVQWIRITYYFFALIMPFACIGVIIILYFVPMKLRTQRLFFMIAEICNAWSAIEVFLISVIASLLELSQFADFIVGDRCDFINKILQRYFDDVLNGQDTCFDVKSQIGANSAYLVIGVILHSFITVYSLRVTHYALEERMLRECSMNSNMSQRASDGEYGNFVLIEKISQSRFGKYLVKECSLLETTDPDFDNGILETFIE